MTRMFSRPTLRGHRRPGTAAAIVLLRSCLLAGAMAFVPVASAAVTVSQVPLTLSNNVPGNLVLTPSVEWPTVMSMANVGGFDESKTYGGYFDPHKCYAYQIAGSDAPAFIGVNGGSKNYFKPVSTTSNGHCSGAWSGNYLDWAATQTIDTFRSSLTGGYRVVDTKNMTILEKARQTGQTSAGNLSLSGSSVIGNNTPFGNKYLYTRLDGLGNRMYFIAADNTSVKDGSGHKQTLRYLLNHPSDAKSAGAVEYNSGRTFHFHTGWVYSVNIDVQVCVPGLLEGNCVKYPASDSDFKPEGLLQAYSKTFTYSVFGYLNIPSRYQDGAALRAQQQFIGPKSYDPTAGTQTNPNAEWSATTGEFIQNPDPTSASDTTDHYGTSPDITHSGVINYINQFGEMTNSNDKSFDPVSEMYYAAIRYLKHQGPVASYNDMTTHANGTTYKMADGFPVIRHWQDPWKYSCQRSFILGIGDVNTWRDKNLPGNQNHSGEPSVPPEVTADTTVNVKTATEKVAQLEGITINGMTSAGGSFSGRGDSAYIAGLAYDSHTVDMRPNLAGSQTVSTFWVDVMENQALRGKSQNQYWLAAKYGGFTVPNNFQPYSTNTTSSSIPLSSWWTNGQTLSTGDKRPDNFFTGGDAHSMATSLGAAFSKIASDNAASGSSLGTNSSQLKTGTTLYRGSYVEGVWTGALKAYPVDPVTGVASTSPLWDAANVMPAWQQRKIYTLVGGQYKAFNASNVSGNGWTSDVVNYIRGDQHKEARNGGSFRNRSTVLGDIIDSQAVYVGKPSWTYGNATFPGSGSFTQFASNEAGRTPTVYVVANDGMLHGFNADTGVETYAYIPGAVLTESVNPSVMAQTNYGAGLNPHQDFNDGQVTVADAYFGSPASWHSVLVGTTGRGAAKAIYALDVTDPSNVKFLWEKSAADSAAIGQIIGKPVVVQTASGVWSVLLGNGYNSANGMASLLQIRLDTGALSVHPTNATTDNGLAPPAAWIASLSDGVSTTAYAGDLQGNVWSFDLSTPTSAGTRVFTATDANSKRQPITTAIQTGLNPLTGHRWIFFGTGRYLNKADLYDNSVQSWYGLMVDPATFPLSKSHLVQRSIIAEKTVPQTAVLARAVSPYSAGSMNGKQGWYMNLVSPVHGAQGERMVVGNQLYNGLLIGTSLIPNTTNVCSPSGTNWVMALNPFTGTNIMSPFFDLNGDRLINATDDIVVNGVPTPASGVNIKLAGSPTIINGSGATNYLFWSPPRAGAATLGGGGSSSSGGNGGQSGQGDLGEMGLGGGGLGQGRVSWREIVNQ